MFGNCVCVKDIFWKIVNVSLRDLLPWEHAYISILIFSAFGLIITQ